VTEIKRIHREGRPVLVGTTSVEKSELLSEMLAQEGIKHQVSCRGLFTRACARARVCVRGQKRSSNMHTAAASGQQQHDYQA
jgi:hypothetical protein